MRIDEGIIDLLTASEFKAAAINIKSMRLFCRQKEMGIEAVLLFYSIYGMELTEQEYKRLIMNIKARFLDSGFQYVKLLGLILTDFPGKARRYCMEPGNNWIIDLSGRRLVIFENQEPDFLGLREGIESQLSDESYETYIRNIPDSRITATDSGQGKISMHTLKRWFSLANTVMIAANILIFLLIVAVDYFGSAGKIREAGALSWYMVIDKGQYYRILTHMFLHSGLEHLFSNLLVLTFVGNILEHATGWLKYLVIYFGSGIIAGIASIGYNMIKAESSMSIGASGAIFGVVGAMIYIIIDNKGRIEGISSRQLILFAIISLYGGIRSVNIDNAAHIGGLLAGIILAMIIYRRNKKADNNKQEAGI